MNNKYRFLRGNFSFGTAKHGQKTKFETWFFYSSCSNFSWLQRQSTPYKADGDR
jgi:hypothetical protein